MTDPSTTLLSNWQSFYVIVGSSSAALIGLQFVVITLVAQIRRASTSHATLSAFATPTVVHFAWALMISAIMSAPWQSRTPAGVAVGMIGIVGVIYALRVIYRARRQRDYKPQWEDWLWHALLPGTAYSALAIGGYLVAAGQGAGFFIAAATALALLFIGIHNAWDTVIYIVVDENQV